MDFFLVGFYLYQVQEAPRTGRGQLLSVQAQPRSDGGTESRQRRVTEYASPTVLTQSAASPGTAETRKRRRVQTVQSPSSVDSGVAKSRQQRAQAAGLVPAAPSPGAGPAVPSLESRRPRVQALPLDLAAQSPKCVVSGGIESRLHRDYAGAPNQGEADSNRAETRKLHDTKRWHQLNRLITL